MLVGVWLKGLRTSSEARQQPYKVHTLKRQGESKLPRQTWVPAAYRIGRIMKLKMSTHSHMLPECTHAGSVLCTRGFPFSLEIAALYATGLSHLLIAQSLDFCLPELTCFLVSLPVLVNTHARTHLCTDPQTFIFAKAPTLLSMTLHSHLPRVIWYVCMHTNICEYGHRITE